MPRNVGAKPAHILRGESVTVGEGETQQSVEVRFADTEVVCPAPHGLVKDADREVDSGDVGRREELGLNGPYARHQTSPCRLPSTLKNGRMVSRISRFPPGSCSRLGGLVLACRSRTAGNGHGRRAG